MIPFHSPSHIFHCSKNNTPLVRLFVNDHLFLHHLKLYLQRPTGDLVLKLVQDIFRLNFRKLDVSNLKII